MKRALTWATMALCLTMAACSGTAANEDDGTTGDESAALTRSDFTQGTTVVTTTRVRLRTRPSTSASVIDVLARGTSLTVAEDGVQSGFVHVQTSDGTDGYCYGAYLDSSGDSSGRSTQGGDDTSFPTSNTFHARGTGYYPASNAMEGGFTDRQGKPLHTLQQFLNGSAPYVAVAMDPHAFGYGQKLRIKELEAKYGRTIDFRVVDTGGAFMGKGRSRIDICTANSRASVDPTINGMLTLAVVD